MKHLWDKFNIKTFPARTRVYLDGIYRADLSDDSDSALPPHIIYSGTLTGEQNIMAADCFLTIKVKTTGKTNININLNGTKTIATVICDNADSLTINITAKNESDASTITAETRVFGRHGSETTLCGTANIAKNATRAISNISFSAMLAHGAKIKMSPNQRINAVPADAKHSASIYTPTVPQVQFLSAAGMTTAQIDKIMTAAFLNA